MSNSYVYFQTFIGNSELERQAVVYNKMPVAVRTSKIRFIPITKHNHPSAKVDIVGC